MSIVDRGYTSALMGDHFPGRDKTQPVKAKPMGWGGQQYDPKKAVSIYNLKNNHCRWPVRDDARGVADLYCGEAIAYENCSYCLTHLARSKQSQQNG